jgi:hypothetical protein
MTTNVRRRQLLLGAGAGAIGSAVAVGAEPVSALAGEDAADARVEGSWYVTVNVTQPTPATFDALYAFARGGAFTRIDGRNNAPALGTWKRAPGGGIIISAILFNFTAGVVPGPATRAGAILGKFAARVVDGKLTGTFTAQGILGLTGFSRAGTFTGTPIIPEGP